MDNKAGFKPTHFREVFSNKGRQIIGPLSEIKDLQRNLQITANSTHLKTITVWKMAEKIPINNHS